MWFHDILPNSDSSITCSKVRRMTISYRDERQAAIFSYNTCLHNMVNMVHLTDDLSTKEAGINLKLAECMQKTCINLNPRLHKNGSYALKCNFYWRLLHMYLRHNFPMLAQVIHFAYTTTFTGGIFSYTPLCKLPTFSFDSERNVTRISRILELGKCPRLSLHNFTPEKSSSSPF